MRETGYLFQSALICAWWLGLTFSETFFAAFQFDGIPKTAFWAFFAPDIILIAVLSLVRAYCKKPAIDYVILGAFAYAALYCCNATVLTSSGYLPTGLMAIGFAYNLFLCTHETIFRASKTGLLGNAAKTLVQIVCIWAISLVFIPYLILDAFNASTSPQAGFPCYAGATIFVCCGSLGLTSAYFIVRDGGGTPLPLDQTNHLVESGPYSYVRNPMAIAGVGQGMAVALIFGSVPILVYALLGAFVWHLVVRPFEERDMVQRFGRQYSDYRQRVTCWIPRLPRDETR